MQAVDQAGLLSAVMCLQIIRSLVSLSEAVVKLPLCVHTVCCGDSTVVQCFLKTGRVSFGHFAASEETVEEKYYTTSNVIGLHASLMLPTE